MELEETGDGEGDDDGDDDGDDEGEKYQTVKSHLKTFLLKKPDEHQEQKQTRTRLIDNVNSYL